ncbi:hypothetical protein [Microlunatus ginsengisoli]|uniref:ParB-like nuclease domain-containing protein n=1 Tax=Microlunatus ginsengisoli TaxID=363863 RepID=A0ABP7AW02_9ACTN
MFGSEYIPALDDAVGQLHAAGRSFAATQVVALSRIVGSVDRPCDFDRRFRPQRLGLSRRLAALEDAYPSGDFPPVSLFELGGLYFVSDGHHRVALAHRLGQEFVEAEVIRYATPCRFGADQSPVRRHRAWRSGGSPGPLRSHASRRSPRSRGSRGASGARARADRS